MKGTEFRHMARVSIADSLDALVIARSGARQRLYGAARSCDAPRKQVVNLGRRGKADCRMELVIGKNKVHADAVCLVLLHPVTNLVTHIALFCKVKCVVGQFRLEEIYGAIIALPVHKTALGMFHLQTVDGDAASVDLEAIARVTAVRLWRLPSLCAVVVVGMPKPSVVQDNAITVDSCHIVRLRNSAGSMEGSLIAEGTNSGK
mmetsp:Transcript_30337/g.66405  ORF Transcript_30337/g.66405 Transcript_30337/m.66405 type:complete len:204 (-) Transcript_30337:1224-1835(-)